MGFMEYVPGSSDRKMKKAIDRLEAGEGEFAPDAPKVFEDGSAQPEIEAENKAASDAAETAEAAQDQQQSSTEDDDAAMKKSILERIPFGAAYNMRSAMNALDAKRGIFSDKKEKEEKEEGHEEQDQKKTKKKSGPENEEKQEEKEILSYQDVLEARRLFTQRNAISSSYEEKVKKVAELEAHVASSSGNDKAEYQHLLESEKARRDIFERSLAGKNAELLDLFEQRPEVYTYLMHARVEVLDRVDFKLGTLLQEEGLIIPDKHEDEAMQLFENFWEPKDLFVPGLFEEGRPMNEIMFSYSETAFSQLSEDEKETFVSVLTQEEQDLNDEAQEKLHELYSLLKKEQFLEKEKPHETSQQRLARGIIHMLEHEELNPVRMKQELGLSDEQLGEVLGAMERDKFIGPEKNDGTRDIILSQEEIEAMNVKVLAKRTREYLDQQKKNDNESKS